jgi:hypothetical protein
MSNINRDQVAPIGKFVNQHLWSDAHVVGKIIGHFGKTGIIVEPWTATKDPNFKPEFIPGGFSAHCLNQNEQSWIYKKDEGAEPIRMRISQSFFSQSPRYNIADEPYEYYDYNF